MPTALRERFVRNQLRRDVVIAFLALVSLGIGVYELMRPRTEARFTLLDAADLGIVLVFIVDFWVQASRSKDAWAYTKRHWWELPSLIPVTGGLIEGLEGFAVLRGIRLVRLVRVVRLFRIIGAAARFRRVRRHAARIVDRARVVELALAGVLFVLVGAAAIFVMEPPQEGLRDFGDALWWSVNLFTTVAYVPQLALSPGGRVVGALLMISGVMFLGVFTASLANAILREPEVAPEDDEPEPALE